MDAAGRGYSTAASGQLRDCRRGSSTAMSLSRPSSEGCQQSRDLQTGRTTDQATLRTAVHKFEIRCARRERANLVI